jgi:TAT-translocated FGD2 family F420-dependent dehydrogenase
MQEEKKENNTGLTGNLAGFMLAHEQFPAPQLADFGEAAEKAGFDLLAISDHFQPWQADEGHTGLAWVTLGVAGQRTKKIWMGPTVTCPTLRYNPAVVAEAFATLNAFFPGRIFLGLGSGEALNEQAATGSWPAWNERSERLIEATEIIRHLWTGQEFHHKRKHYTVDAKLWDPPATNIPILMAANGPKAMHRAGRYADGLVTDPKTWKQHKAEFESGSRGAGKDPKEMPVLVEQYVMVDDKKDAEAAAELWRFGPKAFETYCDIQAPAEIQRQAEAQIPLEKVYGDWPVSTAPEAHIKKLNELFDSGATIVDINSGQAHQMRVIEFYGSEVSPLLNRPNRAVAA